MAGLGRGPAEPRDVLCVETQSRHIMAVLVNDIVAEALRLNLHGKPPTRAVNANSARIGRGRTKVRNG